MGNVLTPGNSFSSDINECEVNTTICPEGSTCVNRRPGYKCRCEKGYEEVKNGEITQCGELRNSFNQQIN